MKKYSCLKGLLIFLVLLIFAVCVLKTESSEEHSVVINLDEPIRIETPCQISVVAATGEKGLRIPAKVGRGWADEAGGKAVYKFYVSQEGRYTIWAYCLWADVCANAVFAKIDESEKFILGNDPVYNKWHWLRSVEVHLEQGTHSFELSNHSDHIAMQKIMLINSSVRRPMDCEDVFSDIFYEGFDGCDRGNFEQWKILAGEWEILDAEGGKTFAQNHLKCSSSENAMMIYENSQWQDYVFNVELKIEMANEGSWAGLIFAMQNEKNYQMLKIFQEKPLAEIRLIEVVDGVENELKSFKSIWEDGSSNNIEISVAENKTAIKINDGVEINVETHLIGKGGIGLRLTGKAIAYFDNIHIRKNEEKRNE